MADKDRKPLATDFKTIYQAPTEESALEALERVKQKNGVEKYPNSMKSWRQNWDAISPISSVFSRGTQSHLYHQRH
ncbi:MAG: transposase [Enterocloster sp.]